MNAPSALAHRKLQVPRLVLTSAHRHAGRLSRFGSLLGRTRSLRLSLIAARTQSLRGAVELARLGARTEARDGRLHVEYRGQCISVDARQRGVLNALAAFLIPLVDAGWTIPECAQERIRLGGPGGVQFEIGRASLVSDLSTIFRRFVEGEYAMLRPRGRAVLDIGANIGDSAIWFALAGASVVHAYEPFVATADLARTNVSLNRLTSTVQMMQQAVGGEAATVVARYSPSVSSELSTTTPPASAAHGEVGDLEQVEVVPFRDAVEQCAAEGANGLSCKIDCEGSEFEIFRSGGLSEALARIDEVLVEFHRPEYHLITETLADAGFQVRIRRDEAALGLIYATRDPFLPNAVRQWEHPEP